MQLPNTPLSHASLVGPGEDAIAFDLKEHGFAGPIPLLSREDCANLAKHLDRRDLPAPLDWIKGRAATDRVIYEIAVMPQLIALLQTLLGPDVVLWGASTARRQPGSRHPWHVDVEGAGADGRVISVWLGLQNVGMLSGLRFITGSHRFGRTIQEVAAGLQQSRLDLTDAQAVEMARHIDPSARIVQPDVTDGQVVLFDSRVWHAGFHEGAGMSRTALLLQYAAADTMIPMPTADGYEWPFRFDLSRRVPTILVSGSDDRAANRLVPPPPQVKEAPMITTLARSIAMPLSEDPVKRWRPYPQFRGATPILANMSCHISVLSAGHHPHPPHIHDEEELLVVLDGEVEIELAEDAAGRGSRRVALRPGMFSYYPAAQHHTIHNVGANPATYLMFKWHAGPAAAGEPLPASIFEYDRRGLTTNARGETRPMMTKLLFQQATHCLGKLHAHLTTLLPGGGYEPHADEYDVAILLLSGEVETVGERVTPFGLIYYSAGELHGMLNPGSVPATYLVFEFHGPVAPAKARQASQAVRADAIERPAGKLKHLRQELKRQGKALQRQSQTLEHYRQVLEKHGRMLEKQRRRMEKQRRNRGLRGLGRRIVKALRRLVGTGRPLNNG